VVGVDPAGTSSRSSDETGIVVCARRGDRFFVLDDLSGRYTPGEWARKAVFAYEKWNADRVVAEKNYGGEMVESTLRNVSSTLPLTLVNSRHGKDIRAEPVVALYEQHRVTHNGVFAKMEESMVEWVPGRGDSPDRIDAMVHAMTSLAKTSGGSSIAVPQGNIRKPPPGSVTLPAAGVVWQP